MGFIFLIKGTFLIVSKNIVFEKYIQGFTFLFISDILKYGFNFFELSVESDSCAIS